MTERTAIVTGAAQGVGAATAERLVAEGFVRFLLIDRAPEPLEETAARMRAEGVEVRTLGIDIGDIAALMERGAAAVADLGPIDLLVNAAGSTARGGLADTSPDTFDTLFAVNVRAPFFLMQLAVPAMRQGATIVNITSMLAHGGPPFLAAYSASKAALVTLTKSVANTLKRDRIRVFGINLGWTWTPGEQLVQTEVHGLPEDWREVVGPRQPFGRLLLPEDPAGVIAFLASPDAAMMTGAIIDLDQFVAGTIDDNPGAA